MRDLATYIKLNIMLMIEPFTFYWFLSLVIGAIVIHFIRQVYSVFIAKKMREVLLYLKKSLFKKNEKKQKQL